MIFNGSGLWALWGIGNRFAVRGEGKSIDFDPIKSIEWIGSEMGLEKAGQAGLLAPKMKAFAIWSGGSPFQGRPHAWDGLMRAKSIGTKGHQMNRIAKLIVICSLSVMAISFCGCGGSGNGGGGQKQNPTTPTVTVTPASNSVTTATDRYEPDGGHSG